MTVNIKIFLKLFLISCAAGFIALGLACLMPLSFGFPVRLIYPPNIYYVVVIILIVSIVVPLITLKGVIKEQLKEKSDNKSIGDET